MILPNKLKNEERFIKIGEESYKVDCSKNTMIEVMALMEQESNSIAAMEASMEKLIGKEGKDAIEARGLNLEDYKTVWIAIQAAASGETYETAEARFQNA